MHIPHLLYTTGRTYTGVSIIFQSSSQVSFIGTHDGSDFFAPFQKTKGGKGPDAEFVLDPRDLIDIDLDKNNIGVLKRHGFKNWGHVSAGAAPICFFYFLQRKRLDWA
jgi:hypothetical protein